MSRIIDYYYSFSGPLIYELAVIANDWCINHDGSINKKKFTNLVESYSSVRKIKNKEIKPNIFKKFKLSEAIEAHELIQSRNSVGSIILCP